MGLDKNGIRFLLYAKTKGTDFKKTAMIGRQFLAINTSQLSVIFKDYGLAADQATLNKIQNESAGYAEFLLGLLGAQEIESFDNSDYEKATFIYDFNNTIPADYEKKFTVVIDSGSLEHIYNFPVALNNCMNMVEPGGHFISITPTNNFCGHGFYQFSPELFFSLLCPQNSFKIIDILSFEDSFDDRWYRVTDPKELNKRITLRSCFPTYLLVLAQRISNAHIPLRMAQQSDYIVLWDGRSLNPDTRVKKYNGVSIFRGLFFKIVPKTLKNRIKRLIYPNPFKPPSFNLIKK
jgi:SAM-dependent methyltransferase